MVGAFLAALVGALRQRPSLDPPVRMLHDGLAEAIKYGCILDAPLFDALLTRPLEEILDEVIYRCNRPQARTGGTR
jgi:3-dehydroquinate synthetase